MILKYNNVKMYNIIYMFLHTSLLTRCRATMLGKYARILFVTACLDLTEVNILLQVGVTSVEAPHPIRNKEKSMVGR